jgi:hypothetical protein
VYVIHKGVKARLLLLLLRLLWWRLLLRLVLRLLQLAAFISL